MCVFNPPQVTAKQQREKSQQRVFFLSMSATEQAGGQNAPRTEPRQNHRGQNPGQNHPGQNPGQNPPTEPPRTEPPTPQKEPPDTTPSHNYPFCCRRIELGENIFKTGTNPYS